MDRRALKDRLYDSKYVMNWHDQIGHEVQTQIVEPKDKLIAELIGLLGKINQNVQDVGIVTLSVRQEMDALLNRIEGKSNHE